MTKRLSRIAALAACGLLLHVADASAQQPLPKPLPWGITGDQASTILRDSADFRIAAHRAGREIYATSQTGVMQAIAVLARDTLVGIIYFQPASHAASAQSLFSTVATAAEREYGPPFCRRGDFAVWPLEHGLLEVRLRRPSGDGHPGAEIRFSGPGFAEEMARRTAASRPAPRPAASPAPAPSSGPRLLGTAVDSVAPERAEAAAAPTVDAEPASAPPPVTPAAAAAAMCG